MVQDWEPSCMLATRCVLSIWLAATAGWLTAGGVVSAAEWVDWPEARYHIIAVNERGEAMMPRIEHREDRNGKLNYRSDLEPLHGNDPKIAKLNRSQRFDAYQELFHAYLGEMGARISKLYGEGDQQGKVEQIAIYIHGGMNSIHGACEKAAELTPVLLEQHYYPIFITWDSNPLTTYADHLLFVRMGRSRRGTEPWEEGISIATAPIRLACDLAGGLAEAPFAIYQQIYNDAATANREWYENAVTEQRMEQIRSYNHGQGTNSLEYIHIYPGGFHKTWAESAGRLTGYFLTLPFKAACAPLLSGLGRPMWENMSRRTKTMFRASEEFRERELSTSPQHRKTLSGYPSGTVGRFLDELAIWQDTTAMPPVTVVGHSMGAIVLNHMLRYQPPPPRPQARIQNIVYMAAACTLSDFESSVIPYLRTHPDTLFYGLSLHPQAEYGEEFFPLIPRGSLLVWIDSFFNDPQTEMDRTAGHFQNVVICSHTIPGEVRPRVTFKSFDVGGTHRMRTHPDARYPTVQPQKHGEFSAPTFQFWQSNFWAASPEQICEIRGECAPPTDGPSASNENRPRSGELPGSGSRPKKHAPLSRPNSKGF